MNLGGDSDGNDGNKLNTTSSSCHAEGSESVCGGSSSKKRSLNSGDVDDLFAQICSRMSSLTTEVEDSKPEVVDIFRSVLMCSEVEAKFFLESASWDIASAVNVYLENKAQEERDFQADIAAESRKRIRSSINADMDISASTGSSQAYSGGEERPRVGMWRNAEVIVQGLDRAIWRAYVSPTTGKIYFLHLATNIKQECVPPGFADNPDYNMNSGISSGSSGVFAIGYDPNMPTPGVVTGRFPPLDAPAVPEVNESTDTVGESAESSMMEGAGSATEAEGPSETSAEGDNS